MAGCIIFPDVAISCYTCIIVCEVTQDLVRAHIICTQSNVHRGVLKIDLLFEVDQFDAARSVSKRESARSRAHDTVGECMCVRTKGLGNTREQCARGFDKSDFFSITSLVWILIHSDAVAKGRRHVAPPHFLRGIVHAKQSE